MIPSAPVPPVILNTGQRSTNEEPQSPHVDPYLFDPEIAQGWPVPDPECHCTPSMVKVRGCMCGNSRLRSHCNNKKCTDPGCMEHLRMRGALSIRDRIAAGLMGRCLIYLVLTVTPRRRAAAADPKTWRNWTRTLIRWMKKNLDFAWGVERTDPASKCETANAAGDATCDCSKCRRWHPHINLLWVRNDGRGFLQPDQLAALKAKWRSIIGEHPENEVVIHTEYARGEDESRIWHLCRYMARAWPRWNEQFKTALRVKWLGSYPTKPKRELKPETCEKCACEVVTVTCDSEVQAEEVAQYTYQQLLDFKEWRVFEMVRRSHDGRDGRIRRRVQRAREMRGEE